MYYPRHLQSVLQKLSAQFPAVLLTGARQVGKSTLLQHIAPEYGYLTLDDPLLLDQAKNEPQLFLLNHTPPLIVDEVQYAPELFPLLKMDIDRRKQNGLYLLSGSQAFELMQNVSESLAGRIAVLKLNGLSWREMCGDDFQTAFVPDEGYLADRNPYSGYLNMRISGRLSTAAICRAYTSSPKPTGRFTMRHMSPPISNATCANWSM